MLSGRRLASLATVFVFSSLTGLKKWIPQARTGVLIVTVSGSDIVLPPNYHGALLPAAMSEVQAEIVRSGHGQWGRRLDDGTQVILLFGRDDAELHKAIKKLAFGEGT